MSRRPEAYQILEDAVRRAVDNHEPSTPSEMAEAILRELSAELGGHDVYIPMDRPADLRADFEQRNSKIFELGSIGLLHRQIAERFGLSRARVTQIVNSFDASTNAQRGKMPPKDGQ